METKDQQELQYNEEWKHEHPWHKPQSRAGRVLAGLVVIAVGCVVLAKQMGAGIPSLVFQVGNVINHHWIIHWCKASL